MRLIDAEAFYKAVEKEKKMLLKNGKTSDSSILVGGLQMVLEWINGQPTIEAKPVVHARNLSADTPSQFECSVCGCEDWDTYTCDVDVYKYCPKCGAQMDEVAK